MTSSSHFYIRGHIHGITDGEESAVESSGGEDNGGVRSDRHSRHRRKRLRRRTLRQMVVAAQPVGWAVRQRQQTAALCRQLAGWGVLLLTGGVAGWLFRVNRQKKKEDQERSCVAGRAQWRREPVVSYAL
jgi:hypothetical protein